MTEEITALFPHAGPRLANFLQQLKSVHKSPLLAWRQTVDPEGHLRATFQDLCRGCALLQFEGDVAELWRELDGDNSGSISFSEVAPKIGHALEQLRERVRERGDCAVELFQQFDDDNSGSLDEEEFLVGCQRQGYDLPNDDLSTLFQALDTDGSGLIHQGEMALLEEDPVERRKLEQRFRDGVTSDITTLQAKAKARLSTEQRKPWQPLTPAQVLAMRRSVQARKQKESQEALKEFHTHLLKTYGNIVRAWRRGLDPHGKMSLNKKSLLRYLRTISFQSDGTLLFMRLDADRDGTCALEELDPIAADVIAHFRLWAFKKFPGGPVQAFEVLTSPQQITDDTRSFTIKAEKRVLRFSAFRKGCERLGFSLDHKEDNFKSNTETLDFVKEHEVYRTQHDPWLKFLFDSLDYSGIGSLTRYDFEFVKNWQPPPWFVVSPDVQGLNALRKVVLDKYGNFVRGWLKAFDNHYTNRVSWSEFVRNCNGLGYIRNLPGIFAALDPSKTGWISLRDIDRASHEYLRSFKNWADNTFGGVVAAFSALDSNGDCELTLTELRKAAKRYSWGGSVKTLFKLLDTENEHRLTVQAVQFLDDWELDKVDDGGNKKGYGIFELSGIAGQPKQARQSSSPASPSRHDQIDNPRERLVSSAVSGFSNSEVGDRQLPRSNSAPGSRLSASSTGRSGRLGSAQYNPSSVLADQAGIAPDQRPASPPGQEIQVEVNRQLLTITKTESHKFAPLVRHDAERKKKKKSNNAFGTL